jgi:hypothetical protein
VAQVVEDALAVDGRRGPPGAGRQVERRVEKAEGLAAERRRVVPGQRPEERDDRRGRALAADTDRGPALQHALVGPGPGHLHDDLLEAVVAGQAERPGAVREDQVAGAQDSA